MFPLTLYIRNRPMYLRRIWGNDTFCAPHVRLLLAVRDGVISVPREQISHRGRPTWNHPHRPLYTHLLPMSLVPQSKLPMTLRLWGRSPWRIPWREFESRVMGGTVRNKKFQTPVPTEVPTHWRRPRVLGWESSLVVNQITRQQWRNFKNYWNRNLNVKRPFKLPII